MDTKGTAMYVQKTVLGINVTQIFIGLQRALLARVDWEQARRTRREVCIPCRMHGWQNLSGRVIQILMPKEGHFIILHPTSGSLLQSWRCGVRIWFPTQGPCGVVNANYPHLKLDAVAQAIRGTAISVGQAFDNGWL